MTGNWTAIAMIFVALFLLGGVFSFIKQGIKAGAAVCGVGAALALVAGVLWW
ncbi:hypothetical protein Sme01_32620 [Sphaerisporangium melleum]|uniref:Amidotransferase n=1 Tax=Sphaerisporangium melleum TaxID=321316 RepID=A0A917VQZ7_9ACTN|nr:hypothetical protein [Sphaerisporangium melleum]GGL10020.1 hypothetical protein GCM10007964_60270 [Sphaerisporangium melleum]GII70786.1 hypothetical protein Sme01_32620 [Sphaerisporangium melleum]